MEKNNYEDLLPVKVPSVTVHKPLTIRDGPLEKLGGGGEFSSRRNLFLLSNSSYEFF